MKFSKVIGDFDKKIIADAEKALSAVMLEIGVKSDNAHVGSSLGGDPLLFTLIYPMEHIATKNIPTAGTDGKRYYWNPEFVLKLNRVGLRIVCAHEAWHAIYMHPQRRGSRNPKLWNIAVDYIVNGVAMDDLKSRGQDPGKLFKENLGNYVTLDVYAKYLQDPFNLPPEMQAMEEEPEESSEEYSLTEDEENNLTEEEKKELKEVSKKKTKPFYFADPNLDKDLKKPEKIYDYLYSLLPKCPECGKVGVYVPPKDKNDGDDEQQSKSKQDGQNNEEKDQGDSGSDGQDKQDQGDGQCDHDHGCGTCGHGHDIFGMGDTLDEHMDSEESQDKMAKRLADAIHSAKRMAGTVPAGLEEELGKLMAPKIRWQDIIRSTMTQKRDGNSRNDWTRFKSRPLFAGLLTPRRVNNVTSFAALLDTSGSMSVEDMTFGISQLQVIDERSEGWVVPADCEIYWDKATKLRKVDSEELGKVKVVGRGGTMYHSFFSDYEKKLGKCDFLMLITDGYLMDTDIAEMRDPGVPVYWIITSTCEFKPPFGRVFYLRN
jgi:predicted metal-dependent peptidase